MGRLVISILLALALAKPALAGAWLREKGSAFTALSVTAHRTGEGTYYHKSSVYAEWGMAPWLTLGLDANERQDFNGHALVFARLPVADLGAAGRLAAEFGLGTRHRQMDWRTTYKATLSWGKGFAAGRGEGWIALDAAVEFPSAEDRIRKLDLTAGLSSGRRFDPLLQIETSRIRGRATYWSATPSLMIRSRGVRAVWLLGVEHNSAFPRPGLKLALWREF
ncbi:hypothetical protein FGK63_03415 [Ruegeria sediminis]|uniref:Cellulose biosynthesis protein BcsS n=1 Tax=Ruegeria sediminis TaxID=2583820 RepID=A0ABY2X5M4_9RHOB|nr:hypothetical protein [Ruegeria sediminis]TMV10122.1 hypothetical protein FGK63_03415 [Ruegeria sediminis]